MSLQCPSQTKTGGYKQITLLRLTYEYVLSEVSRDNFLRHFLQAMKTQVDDEFHFEAWDEERKNELGTLTACFADRDASGQVTSAGNLQSQVTSVFGYWGAADGYIATPLLC